MSLKSIDFFKRLQTQQSQKSSTGGLFTIISFCLAALLAILSFQDYTRIEYQTSLVIKNDPTQYLPMDIDIYFNAAPCQLVTLTFNDELQYEQTRLQESLNKTVVKKEGDKDAYQDYVQPSNDKQLRQQTQQAMKNGYGCRLRGKINLPKTPGTLIFGTIGQNRLAYEVDLSLSRKKIRASYILYKLQFGQANSIMHFPVTHYSEGIKQYIQQLESDIYTREVIQDFSQQKENLNFYSHLKIIPIEIGDQNGQQAVQKNENGEPIKDSKSKYRFSIRSGRTPTAQIGPDLTIMTQIEPIHIVYTSNKMSIYELSVSILAIVGGSVATVGTLNLFSHYIFGIGSHSS